MILNLLISFLLHSLVGFGVLGAELTTVSSTNLLSKRIMHGFTVVSDEETNTIYFGFGITGVSRTSSTVYAYRPATGYAILKPSSNSVIPSNRYGLIAAIPDSIHV